MEHKIKDSANYQDLIIEDSIDDVTSVRFVNTKAALRNIAEKAGISYEKNWTTRQLGGYIIKVLNTSMADKNDDLARFEEFKIIRDENGSIFVEYATVTALLRHIANQEEIEISPDFNQSENASKQFAAIPKPSITEVKKYQDKFLNDDSLENYRVQQDALDLLYKNPNYKNDKLEIVLLKAVTLNDFYSTRIMKIYTVAEHISTIKNLDQRLAIGDESLVDEIKKVKFGEKEINFYSFATKFCSNHNPTAFPIYDSFVDEMLNYFNEKYQFTTFKKSDLKDYSEFKRVIKAFQSYFGLEECSLREIDLYLWLLGKEKKADLIKA